MSQKGFINILLLAVAVSLVGGGIYVVSTRHVVSLPTPIPDGTQTTKFYASPKLGAPPLSVSFREAPYSPKDRDFSGYSIDYGDGSQDSIQPKCGNGELGSISGCAVGARHTYTSSGTFTATLHGMSAGGNSKILGIVKITVGNPLYIIRTVGEEESTYLIQTINPNSVEGLWSWAGPVSKSPPDPSLPRTLHIGDDIGYECEGISEKLTSIDYTNQTVIFTRAESKKLPWGGCPICLSGNTLIDTPSGPVPVKDLQIGMSIWTTDGIGHRVSGIITKTSKVPVSPTHQMVHLVLGDGRELFASPGHPTIDGRSIGELMPGDLYDGASIVSVQRVPYGERATYDVLSSGETGFYWANGVLIDSTLHSH